MGYKNKNQSVIIPLISFCLPLILSGMLQQLYNWADAFIIGNTVGELALGAVGATTSPINFFLTLMTGFTLGLSVLVAGKHGAGDSEDISQILSAFSLLAVGVFFCISLAGVLWAFPFMVLLHTPSDAIGQAADYIRIIFIGFPFLAIYNVYAAVIRGIGDSRTPFFSILLSSVLNVALDLLFVIVFNLGVKGAAAATVLSQILMTVFVVVYAYKKHPLLRTAWGLRRFRHDIGKTWREGVRFGLPPMIQGCVISIGSLVLQNFMNGFGSQTVIAITAAYRIDSLVLLPIINLGSGISTFTANGYGARDRQKISGTFRSGLLLACVVSVLLTVFVIPTGGKIIGLFGAGSNAVHIGTMFFLRLAAFYPVYGIATAFRGYLEGMGDLVYSSAAGILSLLVRIAASYLLVPYFGNMIIAYAEVISWVVLMLLYLVRIRFVRRKNAALFAD